MPRYSTDKLRNVVLISHSGAGKTILSEAMLHTAGATTRLGSVEDGTTVSDFEPEEERRQGSVQTAILTCPWRDSKINILDTPGYADFRGEVISAVRVADAAVIVVACPYGVEVGTAQMWKMADQRKLPRVIYISKMDRENADFDRALESLTERFGRGCVPVQVPIGSESGFSGIVNLLDPKSEAPDEMAGQVEAARERLIEAVAEADDDLANKYLEGEEITQAEMVAGLKQGIAAGLITPVMVGSSTSEIGAREMLDAIVDFLPSPADVGPVPATAADGETSLAPSNDGPLAALVFKTAADPFVGKLSYFRVYSGNFTSDSQLWDANTDEAERIGQVFVVNGKEQEAVSDLATGDIGATPKLNSVLTGHTLCTRENQMTLEGLVFPPPVYQMAVFPKSQSDVDKMSTSLTRIVEEDPSLTVTREPNTLEVLVGGLGDTHVEIAIEKMKRKFGSEMVLELPKVPYKETVSGTAKVEYRHKKQSGGHGQYGHVWLEIEPLERGSGFKFEQKVVGGSVPREYIPSVEKGVAKAMNDGAIAGYPIVDVKATLFDGSFHTVDSSGICFEIAGSAALTRGVQLANPVLLEPVMQAQITVPDEFAGDIIGDLNAKRGRIQGMTPQGDGTTLVEAEVPQGELLRYATDLRSMTQGQGTFTLQFDHYEQMPAHLVDKVIQDTKERELARA
ncbi:MAG: elongation factor G [Chloroflexi bacterium]|nr:elongation factor G [Chloroflexota bacterium]MCI0771436.1 elongation factor G [Chloroflexota bacterium]MCI0790832.1 elongation factor G [Chloroflexota bacterium]MCI0868625.1 elongation factor G [Chloroflexota bacterium]